MTAHKSKSKTVTRSKGADKMSGAFCEQYGNSMRNRALEHFLENMGDRISVGQMAEELEISKPKAYQIVKDLIKEKLVVKSKKFRGAQLYDLNKSNPRVKLLEKNFGEVLDMVVKEYSPKKKSGIEEQNELLRELIKGVNELKRKINS